MTAAVQVDEGDAVPVEKKAERFVEILLAVSLAIFTWVCTVLFYIKVRRRWEEVASGR